MRWVAEPQVRAIDVNGATRRALVFPMRNGYLALLREGLYAKSVMSRHLVRWETIERLAVVKVGSQTCLVLRSSSPAEVDPAWLGAIVRFNRPISGWDVTYPLGLVAGGGALPALVARYVRRSEARGELG